MLISNSGPTLQPIPPPHELTAQKFDLPRGCQGISVRAHDLPRWWIGDGL